MEIHSTALKKSASDILETNAYDKGADQVEEKQRMVILNEPYLDIYRSVVTASTIFTTPSNNDFFLTSAGITHGSSTTSLATITFVTWDGQTRTLDCQTSTAGTLTDGVNNSIVAQFGKRGLKLAKNSAISFAFSGISGSAFIVGYTGSDRS